MEGDGPTKGEMVSLHVALASQDAVALDSVACRLIRIKPEDIGYLVFAAKEGLGEMNEKQISILGESDPVQYQQSFVLPSSWDEHIMQWKNL